MDIWPESYPIRIVELFVRQADRHYAVGAHAHNARQWYQVLQGETLMECQNQTFILQSGEGLMMAPGAIRSPRAGRQAPHYLVAVFDADARLGRLPENQKVLLPPARQGDLMDLVRELQQPGRDGPDLRIVLLTRLLMSLEPQSKEVLDVTAEQRQIVEQACQILNGDLAFPLQRQQLARALGISGSHLARIFNAHLGMTPQVYQTRIRLQRAQMLLTRSTLPITQIAQEVGFQSFSYFSQSFKRCAGISPRDYRREHATEALLENPS